jgi:NADPH:quinone reductase-like Zn-dependent oxidoreductase
MTRTGIACGSGSRLQQEASARGRRRAMRAVICTGYGPPEVLRLAEVERPTPRRNQICIRVVATSVTVSDCVVRGLKAPRLYRFLARLVVGWKAPRQPILGMVLAGDVESVGRNVGSFKKGDPVFGLSQWKAGAYAEEVCWPAGKLVPKPTNLSYEEAAALPYGGLLAMHCLRKARIQPGQRVLVYGASGAIGTSAVQLARHLGAVVTGVCSAANLKLVESLGAETVLDYTREDFTSRGERYDLVFDAVGRRKSAGAMRDAGRALTAGGACISIDDDLPRPTRQDLDLLKQLAESGAMKPVIDRCYPLEEIVEAHRYVELGHKKGNVIVTVEARAEQAPQRARAPARDDGAVAG